MTSIKMIEENNASGKVKEIYDEIKKSLGIDFVPNLYKVMAHNPDYLELNGKKSKTIMHQNSKLDAVTKEAIAIAVATTIGCDYGTWVHTSAVQKLGLDDAAILEIMAVIDLFSGFSNLMKGLDTERDDKPWYGGG